MLSMKIIFYDITLLCQDILILSVAHELAMPCVWNLFVALRQNILLYKYIVE